MQEFFLRVFKTRWFERFAKKHIISDLMLRDTIERVEKGLVDADLGNGVIKLRIARPGEGRSSGYRVIVLFKRREYSFFVYGYSKSNRENIKRDEEQAFRDMAHHVLVLSETEIGLLLEKNEFVEISYEQKISQ